MCAGTTQRISVAALAIEMTGSLNYHLSILVTTVISFSISRQFTLSIFDLVILLKVGVSPSATVILRQRVVFACDRVIAHACMQLTPFLLRALTPLSLTKQNLASLPLLVGDNVMVLSAADVCVRGDHLMFIRTPSTVSDIIDTLSRSHYHSYPVVDR